MQHAACMMKMKVKVKVTPPLAVAPPAQEDDMRWNPSDDGINMYP